MWLRTFDHQQVDGTSSTVRRVIGSWWSGATAAANPLVSCAGEGAEPAPTRELSTLTGLADTLDELVP
jgi:hypothetical protein